MGDPAAPWGIKDGVDCGRERTSHAGFARALDAKRVGPTRNDMVMHGHLGHVASARHRVIHESRGQHLAVVTVDYLLADDLPDPLRHAAVDLPFHDRLMQDIADVIDRGIGHDRYHSGLWFDLPLAVMAPVRKTHRWRYDFRVIVQST